MHDRCPRTDDVCEKSLLAYEIHDGLTQLATTAMWQLETAINCKVEGEAEAGYKKALETSRQVVIESRRLISGLRLSCLGECGVIAAIGRLVEASEIETEFKHNVLFTRLKASLENSMYRIVQESLSNIRKHSGSDKAVVDISQNNRCVTIVVRDWGIGFDTKNSGCGLEGIRERAKLFGGEVKITSEIGKGTTVVVVFNLNEWEKS